MDLIFSILSYLCLLENDDEIFYFSLTVLLASVICFASKDNTSIALVWETRVQYQAASYQRLKKWYLIPPCLTLSNIRYVSRVKWSNPGKGVVLSPIPRWREPSGRPWLRLPTLLTLSLLAYWVKCLPIVQETRVQSPVKSYQRLKKWYLMPPCLALGIIKLG